MVLKMARNVSHDHMICRCIPIIIYPTTIEWKQLPGVKGFVTQQHTYRHMNDRSMKIYVLFHIFVSGSRYIHILLGHSTICRGLLTLIEYAMTTALTTSDLMTHAPRHV